MRGRFSLEAKVREVGKSNCFLSEITIAELKYGISSSVNPEKHRKTLEAFIIDYEVVPIFPALDIYAKEKARLRRLGSLIGDFDILIGATAISNGMKMVTNNVQHLGRLEGIVIEDWTKHAAT
jgi:tRNA(fMet)-specific endonuclease VapC